MAQDIDITAIARAHGRYPPDAYVLVGEGLRHAARRLGRVAAEGAARHLTAAELVDGLLELAAERWGLLAAPILNDLKLRRSEDIGAITFHLIEHGVFGRQPSDSVHDFDDLEAFAPALERLTRIRLAQVGHDE